MAKIIAQMKCLNIKWVVLFLSLYPISLFASTPVLLNDNREEYPLGRYIQLLEDVTGQLQISDVISAEYQGKFRPSRIKIPNLGITDSSYWVRFDLANESAKAQSYLLEIAYPLHDKIDLYLFDAYGNYEQKGTGDIYPFSQRDILHRYFLFDLELPALANRTVYMRFQTQGSMQLPMTLWKPEAYIEKVNIEQYVFGLYYGVMLVMVLYNLFIFFSIRDRAYLYYVAYIACLTVMQMSLNGFAFEYFWSNYPLWANKSLPVFVFLTVFAGYLFSRRFLDTRNTIPMMDILLSALLWLALLGAVVSIVLPYSLMIMMSAALAIISPVILLLAGFICLAKGGLSTGYYLTAWSLLIMGAVVYALKGLGILPSIFYTEYAIHIGSVFEIVLLSLGITNRISTLEREKIIAHRALQLEQKIALAFEKFVPKQFVLRAGKDRKGLEFITPGNVEDGYITILFSDVRSFTEISEPMTPQEVFKFLNSYLARMQPSIQKNGGFVDKFIGDAIMALFELESKQDSAYSAIQAAIGMQNALVIYNKHRRSVSYPPIETGIGIHSGDVMIGTVGSNERMEFTAIGNAVNVSSRLEGLTKFYGAKIIASRETMDLLPDRDMFKHRILDWLRVKGKTQPIEIYEILETDSGQMQEAKIKAEKYIAMGLQHRHKKEFDRALKYFNKGLKLFPKDEALKFHCKTCAQLLKNKVERNWDGAIDMKSK